MTWGPGTQFMFLLLFSVLQILEARTWPRLLVKRFQNYLCLGKNHNDDNNNNKTCPFQWHPGRGEAVCSFVSPETVQNWCFSHSKWWVVVIIMLGPAQLWGHVTEETPSCCKYKLVFYAVFMPRARIHQIITIIFNCLYSTILQKCCKNEIFNTVTMLFCWMLWVWLYAFKSSSKCNENSSEISKFHRRTQM